MAVDGVDSEENIEDDKEEAESSASVGKGTAMEERGEVSGV